MGIQTSLKTSQREGGAAAPSTLPLDPPLFQTEIRSSVLMKCSLQEALFKTFFFFVLVFQ